MTLISHKHKFVFLANQKCGSTTLHEMLKPFSDKAYTFSVYQKPLGTHATAREVRKYLEKRNYNWDDYYVFTTIREPYSRIKSCYRYETDWKKHRDIVDLFIRTPKSFKRYVMEDWFFRRFIDINEFIGDENKKSMIQQVIKMEDFDKEIPKLIEKLDLPLELEEVPKTNVTNKSRSLGYDDEMIAHLKSFNFGDFDFYDE